MYIRCFRRIGSSFGVGGRIAMYLRPLLNHGSSLNSFDKEASIEKLLLGRSFGLSSKFKLTSSTRPSICILKPAVDFCRLILSCRTDCCLTIRDLLPCPEPVLSFLIISPPSAVFTRALLFLVLLLSLELRIVEVCLVIVGLLPCADVDRAFLEACLTILLP